MLHLLQKRFSWLPCSSQYKNVVFSGPKFDQFVHLWGTWFGNNSRKACHERKNIRASYVHSFVKGAPAKWFPYLYLGGVSEHILSVLLILSARTFTWIQKCFGVRSVYFFQIALAFVVGITRSNNRYVWDMQALPPSMQVAHCFAFWRWSALSLAVVLMGSIPFLIFILLPHLHRFSDVDLVHEVPCPAPTLWHLALLAMWGQPPWVLGQLHLHVPSGEVPAADRSPLI